MSMVPDDLPLQEELELIRGCAHDIAQANYGNLMEAHQIHDDIRDLALLMMRLTVRVAYQFGLEED